MTVCYLDVDDEITDAVAGLRTTGEGRFILVLPPGSRIATSRINFRLLAREGQERDVLVGLVSSEPAVRSLAISAGMPAYATVEEAESALGEGPQPTSSAGEARADVWARDAAPGPSRPRGTGRNIGGWLTSLAVAGALIVGVLYIAYLNLPSISVSLTPISRAAEPLTVQVTADPSVVVADLRAGIVPAERIDVPLSATDRFPASGSEVNRTRATGSVRFTSENTLFEVPIPEGTRLTTMSGDVFETTQSVTIARASFQSGPATAEAPVRAVEPGEAGNVEAETITGLPEPIATQLVRVTNPEATAGGERIETRVITRADYDTAVAALEGIAEAQLAAALADPETTPRGLRLFPETAVRERLTPDVAAGDLVGQVLDEFPLSVEGRATVLAVEESLVVEVAEERLAASMPAGARLFPDSVATSVAEPQLVDGSIVYEVEATGEHYQPVDPAAAVAAIQGRTISEARAILEAYGSVSITPWPDFIDTVPDDARRISLTVLEPQQRSP
ncbi:hypothetical protein BH24CHL8_BH24CHL8_10050 [soil metagenome]